MIIADKCIFRQFDDVLWQIFLRHSSPWRDYLFFHFCYEVNMTRSNRNRFKSLTKNRKTRESATMNICIKGFWFCSIPVWCEVIVWKLLKLNFLSLPFQIVKACIKVKINTLIQCSTVVLITLIRFMKDRCNIADFLPTIILLHKNNVFHRGFFSVNMTKSAVYCGIGHIYSRSI